MCKFIHNISHDFSRSLFLIIFKTATTTAPLPNSTAQLLLHSLCDTQYSSTYSFHVQLAEASGQLHVPPLNATEGISGNH